MDTENNNPNGTVSEHDGGNVVLVVDDEAMILNMTSRILQTYGYRSLKAKAISSMFSSNPRLMLPKKLLRLLS